MACQALAAGAALTTGLALAGDTATAAAGAGSGHSVSAGAETALDAAIGERLFRRAWVPGQSSTKAADGLGPLFNARSCLACHEGLGRVAARHPDALDRGLAVRLGDADGRADPALGRQIQLAAVAGVEPEPRPRIEWVDTRADGSAGRPDSLRPRLVWPDGGARAGSIRAAPALAGLGRLAALTDAAILGFAEEQSRAGQGVAGRPHRTADGRLGRFGWKATAPTMADQVADAFSIDMGLSTRRHPEPWGDCTASETACRLAPHGSKASEGGVEMDDAIVARLAAYLISVTVPPAPADGRGAALFAATGCAACHRADLPSPDAPALTDLLLHDMGPGLDDGVGDGAARPRDWRTAPLIGLGAAEARGLLHDGRARSIAEAVAWHGGEGAGARARFRALPPADRDRLIAFLRSL
ncbi:c-type cytochrome [Hyphomicrobiaceae bacterium 22]|uniref:C-type cytochrome n=2 Tax=Prosthecodimorpha staleyi TaxID=2840188 RepID=A0A947DBE6_9HYPH|nr:c-type cytochrome [Prosthecodimorpha staleyi]